MFFKIYWPSHGVPGRVCTMFYCMTITPEAFVGTQFCEIFFHPVWKMNWKAKS